MGRLTLNVFLSFAQFEREVTGERIRDKIAASKKKGMWMDGNPPIGYDAHDRKLVVNEEEAATVRYIFRLYRQIRSGPQPHQAPSPRIRHSREAGPEPRSDHAAGRRCRWSRSLLCHRLLRLTFLAPDIVTAIVGGRQPIELTASRLMNDTRLPLEWQAQGDLPGVAEAR